MGPPLNPALVRTSEHKKVVVVVGRSITVSSVMSSTNLTLFNKICRTIVTSFNTEFTVSKMDFTLRPV